MGEPDDEDRPARTPLEAYEELRSIARSEYPALVSDAVIERTPADAPRNLRVFFVDGGFLDVWLSEDRYSFHFQSDGDVVRFDNAPHHDHVDTHPHHRHEGGTVADSPLRGKPVEDFRSVMEYLRRTRLT